MGKCCYYCFKRIGWRCQYADFKKGWHPKNMDELKRFGSACHHFVITSHPNNTPDKDDKTIFIFR